MIERLSELYERSSIAGYELDPEQILDSDMWVGDAEWFAAIHNAWPRIAEVLRLANAIAWTDGDEQWLHQELRIKLGVALRKLEEASG